MKQVLPFLLIALTATPALAEEWSLDVFLGPSEYGMLSWGGSDRDAEGSTVSGFAVQRMNPDTRLEFGVELSRSENQWTGLPDEDQDATSLMATGTYTFRQGDLVDGYAGVGLGVLRVGYEDGASSDSDDTLGGQVILGARYKIPASKYQAFVEYRYTDAFKDASLSSGNDVEYSRQDVVLGIRLGF